MPAGQPLNVFLMNETTQSQNTSTAQSRNTKIAVIGAGDLGTSVIDSLYTNGHRNILATRRDADKLSLLGETYDISTTTSNREAAEYADIIILGVKPAFIETVCNEIAGYTEAKLVISLAAAVPIKKIQNTLGKARVARVMTDLSVQESVACYSLSKNCSDYDTEAIEYIFGADAEQVKESMLAARTAVACHEGILAMELDVIRETLMEQGYSAKQASAILAGTLRGISSHLERGSSGRQIYDRVAGPSSFTAKMHDFIAGQGYFRLVREYFGKVIEACSSK